MQMFTVEYLTAASKRKGAVGLDKVNGIVDKYILKQYGQHLDVDAKTINELLFVVCKYEFKNAIVFCVKQPDCDVNLQDELCNTPLNISCSTNFSNMVIVKLLLEQPSIDVNKPNFDGQTPLHGACESCYVEMVQLLLTHPNIKINEMDNEGLTALSHACEEDRINTVKLLLNQPGIDINKSDGVTPLHIASDRQHSDIVKMFLCQPSIDVNKLDYNGDMSIDIARETDNKEIIALLMSHGSKDSDRRPISEFKYGDLY